MDTINVQSCGSSINIVNRKPAKQLRNCGLFLSKSMWFFPSSISHSQLQSPPSLLFNWYCGHFPWGTKWPLTSIEQWGQEWVQLHLYPPSSHHYFHLWFSKSSEGNNTAVRWWHALCTKRNTHKTAAVTVTGKGKERKGRLLRFQRSLHFQGQAVLIWPDDNDNIFLRNDTCPPHYRTYHIPASSTVHSMSHNCKRKSSLQTCYLMWSQLTLSQHQTSHELD